MKRETKETPVVKIAGQPIPCWLVGMRMENYREDSYFSELNQEIFTVGDEEKKDVNIHEELNDILAKEYQVNFETLGILSSFSDINLAKREFEAVTEDMINDGGDVLSVAWLKCELPKGTTYVKLNNGIFISDHLNILGVMEKRNIPKTSMDDFEAPDIEDPDFHPYIPPTTPLQNPNPIRELKMDIPEGWKIGEIKRDHNQLIIPLAPENEITDFDELTLEMEKGDELYLPDSEYGRAEEEKLDGLQQLIRTAAFLNYKYPNNQGDKWIFELDRGRLKLTTTIFPTSIFFNTRELAERALSIIGEKLIKAAISPIKFTGK